jgi:hypothetical protein
MLKGTPQLRKHPVCMFHFNYNFTIIVPNAFNYLKNVTWEQCSVELKPKIDLLRQITILPTKMSDFHR